MTTPALTAEPDWTAIDRLRVLSQRLTRVVHVQPSDLVAVLAALDQPTVARHVRETGCPLTVERLATALRETFSIWAEDPDDVRWDVLADQTIAALASPATEACPRTSRCHVQAHRDGEWANCPCPGYLAYPATEEVVR